MDPICTQFGARFWVENGTPLGGAFCAKHQRNEIQCFAHHVIPKGFHLAWRGISFLEPPAANPGPQFFLTGTSPRCLSSLLCSAFLRGCLEMLCFPMVFEGFPYALGGDQTTNAPTKISPPNIQSCSRQLGNVKCHCSQWFLMISR